MNQDIVNVFLQQGILGAIVIVLCGVVAYLAKKYFSTVEELRKVECSNHEKIQTLLKELLQKQFDNDLRTTEVYREMQHALETLIGRINGYYRGHEK